MEDGSSTGNSNPLVDAVGMLSQAYRYSYAGRCWWCGQAADSGEHKYKRTDLVRAFGNGPWKNQSSIVRLVGEQQQYLQSPGSAGLKFDKVLCGNCNSSRSQAFDLAYDEFSQYVASERERILADGGFRWSHILGTDWRNGRNLVTAFWVKHIGCRLAEGGVEVDPRIIDFLDHPDRSLRGIPLRLELQIQEDLVAASDHLQKVHGENLNSLWLGDLMCLYSRSRQRVRQATSHLGVGWLWLTYQFDFDHSRMVSNFWSDRVRLARVGTLDPVPADQNCKICHPD